MSISVQTVTIDRYSTYKRSLEEVEVASRARCISVVETMRSETAGISLVLCLQGVRERYRAVA